MSFAVDKRHRDVYKKQGWIEFESLFPQKQMDELYHEAKRVVDNRVKASKRIGGHCPEETLFLNGRDIWRESPLAKKVDFNKGVGAAITSLIEKKPLRIGYDHFYEVPIESSINLGAYSTLLASTPNLEESTCLQGVLCGMIVCVKGTDEQHPSSPFPTVAGNAVVIASTTPIPYAEMAKHPGAAYLMVVYVEAKSVYIHKEADPHLNTFKTLGYSFGDRLKDTLHPIAFI